MPSYKHTWTEQLYRYAEHLYWVPQHINKKTPPGEGGMAKFKKTRAKIRSQETPLNILFNIAMRLFPVRIRKHVLSCFVASAEARFGQEVEYVSIHDQLGPLAFIQPDTVLSSEKARICIELKINAPLSLNQLYKYLFLLGLWEAETNEHKVPYLFFLTKKNLRSQWKAQERQAGSRKQTTWRVCTRTSEPVIGPIDSGITLPWLTFTLTWRK